MRIPETDIHCHILPGIDDGAEDLDTALAMAQAAVKAGFKTVIATPHYETYCFENTRDVVLVQVAEFQSALDREGILLQVQPGSEVMLGPEIPKLLAQQRLMTLRDEGRQLLVELPLQTFPLWAEAVLYEIQLQGIQTVLAHPERYQWLDSKLDWLYEYKEKGGLVQGNLGSLIGKYGRSAEKKARLMIREDLADFWGSDAHSVHSYESLM